VAVGLSSLVLTDSSSLARASADISPSFLAISSAPALFNSSSVSKRLVSVVSVRPCRYDSAQRWLRAMSLSDGYMYPHGPWPPLLL